MARLLRALADCARGHGWLTILVIICLIFSFPVACWTTRLLLLICVVSLWLWGAFLLRRRRAWVAAVLVSGVVALVWLCLPGRPGDDDALRSTYVQCLKDYTGTRYVWGGENRLGIDCSGLVRRGFINANAKMGLRTFNPELVRTSLSLWWHDCSARALRDGYRGLTTRILSAPSINSIDHDAILAGDLAVTANGVHVLAYLGGNLWIEADPIAKRVITVEVPSSNAWFTMPVQLVRWSRMNEVPDKNTGSGAR